MSQERSAMRLWLELAEKLTAAQIENCRSLLVEASPFYSDVEKAQYRRRRPKGECTYCDEHGDDPMMPSHMASARCESGKHPHCTCDTCF